MTLNARNLWTFRNFQMGFSTAVSRLPSNKLSSHRHQAWNTSVVRRLPSNHQLLWPAKPSYRHQAGNSSVVRRLPSNHQLLWPAKPSHRHQAWNTSAVRRLPSNHQLLWPAKSSYRHQAGNSSVVRRLPSNHQLLWPAKPVTDIKHETLPWYAFCRIYSACLADRWHYMLCHVCPTNR